ncbi:FadR/GntR family transcriptional regulator [Paenibacillus physcomitrellae]|uniref:Transcriptional regulator n=1 Tax=Paenibacillus physcomitrellae TaxID=1619311 RepID=A0ABQ1G1Q6_9BACL|nr:FadR/GntR family transcriptional regulator [Paenibacillus physcomitrellae]GGA34924.1 transcriptional regulator [Paenibacillus physcomitrellae]
MINKLRRTSLSGQAYAEMENMISSGTWQLGQRIPSETELMEKLGVSRNTLREAVRALVHVGLLDTRQGDGTFVIATSELDAIMQKRVHRSTLLETLEVRHALDRQAVLLACVNRTDEDLEEIKKYAQLCVTAHQHQILEQFVQADWKLHQAIVTASHNVLLTDIYLSLFAEILTSIAQTTEWGESSQIGHLVLVEAIEERDADKAALEVDRYIAFFKEKTLIS